MDKSINNHVNENKYYAQIRRCTVDDLENALKLQAEVIDFLDKKHLLAGESREEFMESLEVDACFCAEMEGDMIAFAVLVAPRISDRNFGSYLGYNEEKMLKTGSIDTSFVSPKHRGHGLQQKLIRKRMETAREFGAKEVLSTVDPENKYSLRNLEACGLRIIDERRLYGGLNRYIMRAEL